MSEFEKCQISKISSDWRILTTNQNKPLISSFRVEWMFQQQEEFPTVLDSDWLQAHEVVFSRLPLLLGQGSLDRFNRFIEPSQ